MPGVGCARGLVVGCADWDDAAQHAARSLQQLLGGWRSASCGSTILCPAHRATIPWRLLLVVTGGVGSISLQGVNVGP